MVPQPEWQEEPMKDDGGKWIGRFQYWRQNCNGEPDVDVDVYVCEAPDDMPDYEPRQIGDKWYWCCPLCEGRGEIGGITASDPGGCSEPCPACNSPQNVKGHPSGRRENSTEATK